MDVALLSFWPSLVGNQVITLHCCHDDPIHYEKPSPYKTWKLWNIKTMEISLWFRFSDINLTAIYLPFNSNRRHIDILSKIVTDYDKRPIVWKQFSAKFLIFVTHFDIFISVYLVQPLPSIGVSSLPVC